MIFSTQNKKSNYSCNRSDWGSSIRKQCNMSIPSLNQQNDMTENLSQTSHSSNPKLEELIQDKRAGKRNENKNSKHNVSVFDVEHLTRISGGIKMPDGSKLEDNFSYPHYAWDYTEKNRDVVAQKFKSFLIQYEKDKNVQELKKKIMESTMSKFDSKRLTVLTVQYLVCIGGFHEELKKNNVLKCILEGCLVFDFKAQKANVNYIYSIRNLTRGDVPDVRYKEIFEQYRKIFNFENSISDTIKIIDELEDGLEKKKNQVFEHCKSAVHKICPKCTMCVKNIDCTSHIPCGTKPLCQRDYFPLICHCEHFSEKQKNHNFNEYKNQILDLTQQNQQKKTLSEGNWRQKRIPQSKEDWEMIANEYFESKGNLIFDSEFLKQNLVVQNTDYAYQYFFALLQPHAIENMFNYQEKKMNERREIIEKSLPYVISCINFIGKKIEPTLEQAKNMMRWIIDNLSYHPIGAFDKKHFPLFQKLNEIVHNLELTHGQRSLCSVMISEIKTYQIAKILKFLHDDFFTKRLEYEPLGFIDLHRHLWNTEREQYKNTLYKKITNLCDLPPIIKSFFENYHKEQNDSDSNFFCTFLEKINEKKKNYENEINEKKKESINLKNKVNELNEQKERKDLSEEREAQIKLEIKEKRNNIRINSERIDELSAEIEFLFESSQNFEDQLSELFNKYMEFVLNCLINNIQFDKSHFEQQKNEFVCTSIETIKNFIDESNNISLGDDFINQYNKNLEAVNNNNQDIIDYLGKEFISVMNLLKINYSDKIKTTIILATLDSIAFTLNPHNKVQIIQELTQFLNVKVMSEFQNITEKISDLQSKQHEGEKIDKDLLFNLEETKRNFPKNKIHLTNI